MSPRHFCSPPRRDLDSDRPSCIPEPQHRRSLLPDINELAVDAGDMAARDDTGTAALGSEQKGQLNTAASAASSAMSDKIAALADENGHFDAERVVAGWFQPSAQLSELRDEVLHRKLTSRNDGGSDKSRSTELAALCNDLRRCIKHMVRLQDDQKARAQAGLQELLQAGAGGANLVPCSWCTGPPASDHGVTMQLYFGTALHVVRLSKQHVFVCEGRLRQLPQRNSK